MNPSEQKSLTLVLNQSETQAILNLLAEQPFKNVTDLISKIVRQATEQLAGPTEPPAVP